MKKHMTFTLKNRIPVPTLMTLSYRLNKENIAVEFTYENTTVDGRDVLSLISFFLIPKMDSTISLTTTAQEAQKGIELVTTTILEKNQPFPMMTARS
ncbi:hypothetical protein G4V62_05420 [Bacillaceae bacterium SIJ1]|uniref:hypothetical protein n=1 Tax=Litoribacterium kuwaitense TaxID=1398745 RepID=UPI0013ED26B9|nr:hypothetical protein [Litoribacterium kuwaitense]NGP44420.1 hypothetical protein [Litoribacterium kuwaitense]